MIMDQIIQNITEHFTEQLPKESEYYYIDDLKEQDFPVFLVERIRIELKRRLDQSFELPTTEWASIQAEAVRESWQQLLKVLQHKIRLPADYSRPVIESAVADIIKILVQPREYIPALLFGDNSQLPASEVKERSALLVVYPHFGRVINRYMEQKQKDKLSRKHCGQIIRRVDEKVTSEYTAMEWVQMLDPLFTLTDSSVDPELIRIFFEDRDMKTMAAKFAKNDAPLSRTEFIEIFSAPVEKTKPTPSDNAPGMPDRKQKSDSFEKEEASEPAEQKLSSEKKESEDKAEEFAEKSYGSSKKSREASPSEGSPIFDDANAANEEEPSDSDDNKNFQATSDEQTEISRNKEQENEELASLNDIFTSSSEVETKSEESSNESSSGQSDEPDSEEDTEEESPIWRKFMDPEEEQSDQNNNEENGGDQNWFTGESVDTPHEKAREREPVNEQQEELEQFLADDESYFVKELFNGSMQDYRKALRAISRQDSWKDASRLINRNIFKRNMINIYSEAAVDFTDQLQTYFFSN